MRIRTITAMIAPAALLLALAAGCSGKQVTYDDIPVYPGAVQVDREHSTTAYALITISEAAAAKRPDLEYQYRLYALPASANASEVRAFYNDRLVSAGWASTNEAVMEDTGPYLGNAMGWKRQGALSGQVLDVHYFFDGRHGSSFMGLALMARK